MMLEVFGVTEETWRDGLKTDPHFAISETPRFIGRAITALAADGDRHRWNGRSLSSGELAKVYHFTDVNSSTSQIVFEALSLRECRSFGKPSRCERLWLT